MYILERSYPQIGLSCSDPPAVIRLLRLMGLLMSLGPEAISQLLLLSPKRFSSAP